MDELGPAEATAQRFQAAVLAALDGAGIAHGGCFVLEMY